MNLINFLRTQVFSTQLIRGSSIMFFGSILAGFINYLFYPLMAHFLTKADYASLNALISLVNFIAVPTMSLSTIVSKFSAEYRARDELGKVKILFLRLTKWILVLGLGVGMVILFLSTYILGFLNINSAFASYFLAALLLVNLLITIPFGILQGLLKFHIFVGSNVVAASGRLLFSLALVWVGWSLTGSLLGFLLGMYSAYLVTLIPLSKILKISSKEDKVSLSKIAFYSLPTTLAILGLTAMITTDLILVNHFFSKEVAGEYSLGTVLGKIILFSILPLTNVMFPIVAARHAKGEDFHRVFSISLGLVSLIGLGISTMYFIFPGYILMPIGRGGYNQIESELGLFGIFASLQALATFLTYYSLSVNRTLVAYISLAFAIIQAVLIWYYHNSLHQVIMINVWISIILVAVLLVYLYLSKLLKIKL